MARAAPGLRARPQPAADRRHRHTAARGGGGGRGNVCFKSSTRQAPHCAEKVLGGEELWLTLSLKLLADVGLGFLARTVPQMNIFVLGLPLKIALGFFVLMVVLPVTVEIMAEQMETYVEFALRGATAWR